MQKVVIDAATRAKLGPLAEQVALADAAGNIVAYFVPLDLYHRLMTAWEESKPTPEKREE